MNRSPNRTPPRRPAPRRKKDSAAQFRVLFAAVALIAFVLVIAFALCSVLKNGAFIHLSDGDGDYRQTDNPGSGDADKDKSDDPAGENGGADAQLPSAPTPPEKTYRKVTFAAAGDILVHTNVYKYASQLAEGTDAEYDFKPMFANIKELISSADLAYVNEETPCAGKDRGYSGYPTFNTPDEIADAVIDTGFDIVNLANNHMLDKGESGYLRNMEFWEGKEGLTVLGGFHNEEDYNTIRTVEKNGVKIAFLSYTYGTNMLVLPATSELVIPYEDADEIDRQTKEAREIADVVIVSMHWGVEDSFTPTENQKQLARLMADNGVDVIIGMHPHVLQPIEWLDRPDGKKTLCIYSLGNFISTMMYGRNMLGGIATFTLAETDDGFVVEDAGLTPTVTYYQRGFSSPTIYPFEDFTEDMMKNHGAHAYDAGMKDDLFDKILESTGLLPFLKDKTGTLIQNDAAERSFS